LNYENESSKIKEIEVRCKRCNRRLFDLLPGDLYSKVKPIEIVCPRCGAVNVVTLNVHGKVRIRVKKTFKVKFRELPDSHFEE
jgi:phage FluMu protein Com